MATERDLENAIAKYPEIIEPGLELLGRQQTVHGRRFDVLFRDRTARKLLVELKWRAITDKDIGQLMYYEGSVLSSQEPDLRAMLIGRRVPPNVGRALDHHGFGWKELTPSTLVNFLREKQDFELLRPFEEELSSWKQPRKSEPWVIFATPPAPVDGCPALLSVVATAPFDQACAEFKQGREEIYFKTNSPIGKGLQLPLCHVLFKVKGNPAVIAKATLTGLTADNPREKRLRGFEDDPGKYFYGFSPIQRLKEPVPLQQLRRWGSGRPVANDVPGCILVYDIDIEARGANG